MKDAFVQQLVDIGESRTEIGAAASDEGKILKQPVDIFLRPYDGISMDLVVTLEIRI